LDEKLVVEQDSRTASTSNTTFETSETGKFPSKASKPVPKASMDQSALPDSSAAQAPARSAWTKDDDVKGKKTTTTTSISLRAIQEAEARKQQSLKGIEREKEKIRAGITTEVKEDSQPFTTSWGLPTSQAGARSNTYPPSKDVPPLSAPTTQASPASPVWTATVKTPVVKKSMKEIQEEEEKRKKQTTRDISVTVTPKRAYADTTSKASSIFPLRKNFFSH
jgi:PERQ amino acid-rich with GYF domain-containing protein